MWWRFFVAVLRLKKISLVSQVVSKEIKKPLLFPELNNLSGLLNQVETLLQWADEATVAKAASVVAALAKTEVGRTACCCQSLVSPLAHLLATKQDSQLLIQVCRALANICYENGGCRVTRCDRYKLRSLVGQAADVCSCYSSKIKEGY